MSNNYRETIKSRKTTSNELLIGSWVSFYSFETDSFEKQLKQLADAGINFNIFPTGFLYGDIKTEEYWKHVDEEYSKNNMVYLMFGGMNESVHAQALEYAKGKKACIGYHIIDEPKVEMLGKVAEVSQKFKTADNEKFPFTNLFPSYVGTEAMGGTYTDYVQKFIDKIGIGNIDFLSHDYYVFAENFENGGFFADVEVMRALAYKNGKLKTHGFPQSTKWRGMRMPNINEMRWNAYAYLAYGFKALSWFNVVCPGNSDTEGECFSESLIYRDGSIKDKKLWADFIALNFELRGLGSALTNLDTVHAYHTNNSTNGVEYLPDDYIITPEKDEDLIISYMQAKDNTEPYIMIFNKSFKDSISAVFKTHGIKGLEYLNPFTGEYTDIKIGKFEESFRPGEGKLYRLKY